MSDDRQARRLADRTIGRTEHMQVQLLLDHIVKGDVFDGIDAGMDALEIRDRSRTTNRIMGLGFDVQIKLNIRPHINGV